MARCKACEKLFEFPDYKSPWLTKKRYSHGTKEDERDTKILKAHCPHCGKLLSQEAEG